jgi:hypothetical protein
MHFAAYTKRVAKLMAIELRLSGCRLATHSKCEYHVQSLPVVPAYLQPTEFMTPAVSRNSAHAAPPASSPLCLVNADLCVRVNA